MNIFLLFFFSFKYNCLVVRDSVSLPLPSLQIKSLTKQSFQTVIVAINQIRKSPYKSNLLISFNFFLSLPSLFTFSLDHVLDPFQIFSTSTAPISLEIAFRQDAGISPSLVSNIWINTSSRFFQEFSRAPFWKILLFTYRFSFFLPSPLRLLLFIYSSSFLYFGHYFRAFI